MSPCPGALLSITHTQRVCGRDGASKAHGTGAGTREPAAGGPRHPVPRRPQACPPRGPRASSPRDSHCPHLYLLRRNNSQNFNLQLLCKLPPGLIYNS